jgi:replicative DNA helicase
LIDLGEEMVNHAYAADIDNDAGAQIEQAESRLFALAESGQAESGFRPFSHALTESIRLAELAHKREGKIAGVPSGLIDLDRLLGGLHNSDLLILAGRPSMGKTALATNIAFHAATRSLDDSTQPRLPVGFFSLEMSSEQLATRILAEQANLSSQKIRQGELSHTDFDQLVVASQRLERTPLYIDDTPAITVSNLRTRARRLKRQQGLALIVVDYLQLMRPGGTSRSENRVQEVSEITRGLKAVAKELNVPVLALSQLSRAPEMREDKRPQLSDLRESGSIEQDADVVMFVFREQYYLERAEPARRPEEAEDKFNDRHDRWKERCEQVYGTAEVIVAKQRHGPTGTVRLSFDGQTTKFDKIGRASCRERVS